METFGELRGSLYLRRVDWRRLSKMGGAGGGRGCGDVFEFADAGHDVRIAIRERDGESGGRGSSNDELAVGDYPCGRGKVHVAEFAERGIHAVRTTGDGNALRVQSSAEAAASQRSTGE